MKYKSVPISYKSNVNSTSVSPFGKNISITFNSSSNKNNNYNNKITSSIDEDEENDNDYKYNILLKEKNTIIQKLQNQINKLLFKEEEKEKKIIMQKHIIESLKESNKNLQEELNKKNIIIQQNQNIDKKIFHLQKEYLEESNNSIGNNFLYIQSLKEQMNKLLEKEEEINNYKKQINYLKLNLKQKVDELNHKNKLLIKYISHQRNKSVNLNKAQDNYEKISISTGKRAKSMKNYNTNIKNRNNNLKEDLRQVNIRTKKNNINNENSNYNKLLENYNDIKTKCNYYYKLAHHLKSKNNKLNEEIQKLIIDKNILNNNNINLRKLLERQKNINKSKGKNNNQNNIHTLLNNKNIKEKTSIELISDDEKDKNENDNINIINNNEQSYNNKATKKLYEALEHYRELYNQKEKECIIIKSELKEKEKTIESLNSLHNKITEYLTIIDELETNNKNNKEIIEEKNKEINNLNIIKNKYEEKMKGLEKNKELLNKKIDKINKDVKEKEFKIKRLLEELKDKEILIKEEQINSLIRINSTEIKKEDFTKKINEHQSFISQIKKELAEKKTEINKLSEENIFLKKKIMGFEDSLKKIEKEKNEEIEEKTIQLEELVKKLNEQEIQYKGVKYDNQELIMSAKQRINDMKQKEIKINQLINQNENLIKTNQNLVNNNQLFKEEKNRLINNYNILNEDLNKKKENIDYLQSILIQKTELIDKLQKSNNELILESNTIKSDLKQKKIELNQLEIQYNKLKQEKNISGEMINLIEENNKIIIENKTLENELNKISEENNIYNTQLIELNKKYQEQIILIQEKEKELNNMKEASKAILEKHKKLVEEKNPKLEPNSYTLITSKKYNKLTWYLLQKKTDIKNNNNINNDIYNKFIWINGNILTKELLDKFNKFEDDEQKIKDLQEYNINLQKKLERKEESISILDYKNKKLMEQIQNKTFANTGNNKLKFNLIKNDHINSLNNNGSMGERGFESEKFKNILQQLNYSNLRESKLQKEVNKLKEKLKKKEEFEAGFPKHFKDIEPSGNDSGFLDDDLKEQDKKVIFDLVKSDDRDKLSTKKSDTNNNDNMEDNRKLKDEISGLKNKNKEIEIKYKHLEEMVKDLIKNVKYEQNIKPHIVQICQILGYSPQTTQKIVKNKISGLKNFELK